MAREVENDTMALVIKAAHLTEEFFLEAVKGSLKEITSGKNAEGKQTLKQLLKDGSALQNIEVTDKNIKSFENSARRYGIDYALKKLPDGDGSMYVVFFKCKDAEQVQKAFKHYVNTITKERKKPSVKKEIGEITKSQAQDKNRHRAREVQKDRGMQH